METSCKIALAKPRMETLLLGRPSTLGKSRIPIHSLGLFYLRQFVMKAIPNIVFFLFLLRKLFKLNSRLFTQREGKEGSATRLNYCSEQLYALEYDSHRAIRNSSLHTVVRLPSLTSSTVCRMRVYFISVIWQQKYMGYGYLLLEAMPFRVDLSIKG